MSLRHYLRPFISSPPIHLFHSFLLHLSFHLPTSSAGGRPNYPPTRVFLLYSYLFSPPSLTPVAQHEPCSLLVNPPSLRLCLPHFQSRVIVSSDNFLQGTRLSCTFISWSVVRFFQGLSMFLVRRFHLCFHILCSVYPRCQNPYLGITFASWTTVRFLVTVLRDQVNETKQKYNRHDDILISHVELWGWCWAGISDSSSWNFDFGGSSG